MIRIYLGLISVLVILVLFTAFFNLPVAQGQTSAATVDIKDDIFSPASLTVDAGTLIRWTSVGNHPHTVTFDTKQFENQNSDTLNTNDSFSFTFNTPGTYPYHCNFHGGSGGVGMSGVIIVKAVTPPPTPIPDTQVPTAPTNLIVTSVGLFNVNLSWGASTDNVGVEKYKIFRDNVQIGEAFTNTGFPTSYSDSFVSPGRTYSYRVSAFDAAGNESAQSNTITATTQSFATATDAPVIISFFHNNSNGINAAITPGQSTTLIFKVTGTPFPIISINNGIGTVTAGSNILVSPKVTTTYTLTATNSVGTVTASLTVVVSTPSITSPNAATGTLGIPFNYQIIANNSPISFNAFPLPLPAGLSLNQKTGLISGIPMTFGDFTINLEAAAGNGTVASAALSLSLLSNPLIPIITSPAAASGTAGKPFSYQITATNNPTSFDAAFDIDFEHRNPEFEKQFGFSIDTKTGLISGTPTRNENISVFLKATNSNGASIIKVLFFIKDPPVLIITSPASAIATVGSPFSYQITATNSSTSFDADNLPPGLSVDTGTGLISGTPTTRGVFDVGIVASPTFASFKLFIFDDLLSPIIASPDRTVGTVDNIQVQVNALNVRQDAALSASKIGLVRQGEVLNKLEEKNGWVKVELSNGQIGWIFKQYTAPVAVPVVSTLRQKIIVTAWVLNVRSGPGINTKVITTVQRNDVLEKIEEENGWFRIILPNSQNGWVYGKFVK
ncbi:MAG: immunoglobulin I-set domain-containing protein [Microgenomates group bacterium Gr01-1014_16]|nr:MAG: immunoglobulin I-set domain-containing protein [Microgenomates group bacterium Gr01-1014_16]